MAEALQIVVPDPGGSVTRVQIRRWLKQVGEPILAFEPLFEFETAHRTMEFRSPSVGTLSSVTARPGDFVPVGAVVGTIAPGSADTKWTVYREASWRNDFPLLSQIAAWLGWKR
ncbi:lipoyl domain-containing protein [Dongia sp. agr-C8]